MIHLSKAPGLKRFANTDIEFNATTDPITHVAVCWGGFMYTLEKPNRHHDVWNAMHKAGVPYKHGELVHGFSTAKGHWWLRDAAMQHALAIGQITVQPHWAEQNYTHLHSEDLWPDEWAEDMAEAYEARNKDASV